ncbi:hypothetical protein MMC09_003421 [Bachmanniomyces sp. S44760]|nr:hypothetical protein [Bachmanniomyces sp. S44760]
MTSRNLPSVRSFLTSLFDALHNIADHSRTGSPILGSNPLPSASPRTKKLFLTLHCIFPDELLPALDLLDRGLVMKLSLTGRHEPELGDGNGDTVDIGQDGDGDGALKGLAKDDVYYVQSSSSSSSHSRTRGGSMTSKPFITGGTRYEVRLRAWNCTCPAFTFSMVNYLEALEVGGAGVDFDLSQLDADIGGKDMEFHDDDEHVRGDERALKWTFGGLMIGRGAMPVCKHLLACVLIEKCSWFTGPVDERKVSTNELAGWAAGWGD